MKTLKERAKDYLISGHSETYIQFQLWASRDSNTGIRHITEAIQQAKDALIKQ